ncbi:hypothetical protein Tco_0250707 [Tanacetum coccineum]
MAVPEGVGYWFTGFSGGQAQLRIVLSIKDKLNYLEQPIPPTPVALVGQLVAPEITAAHTAWIKGSKEIAGLNAHRQGKNKIINHMEPEIHEILENLHAHGKARGVSQRLLCSGLKVYHLPPASSVREDAYSTKDEHYEQVEEMTRRLDMCEDVQVLTARDGIRRLVDSFYVVDYLLICNTWKPSRDFTRPLGSPSGLKGLLHTLNATVIPTKLYRILMVLVMVDVARRSKLVAWLRAWCGGLVKPKDHGRNKQSGFLSCISS